MSSVIADSACGARQGDLRRRSLEASQSNAARVSKRVANIACCVADDRGLVDLRVPRRA